MASTESFKRGQERVALLQTMPGVAGTAASAIVAEMGTDISRFPSAKHLASWAGLCPGNRQSAGKRLSGQTTSRNVWLRAALGEAAWAISHTSGDYLSAQFHRLARRRGKQKAVLAVAHSVLVILYHLLRAHQPYSDLGADYFEQLERLGYTVTLTPSAA